jgi:hypothetical protein
MNTGALRHQVTLDTTDGTGGVRPLDPPTWDCAQLNEAGGVITFLGRYHAGITTATRVHFKGRVFHVDDVNNRDGRDVELTLTCTEVFD